MIKVTKENGKFKIEGLREIPTVLSIDEIEARKLQYPKQLEDLQNYLKKWDEVVKQVDLLKD